MSAKMYRVSCKQLRTLTSLSMATTSVSRKPEVVQHHIPWTRQSAACWSGTDTEIVCGGTGEEMIGSGVGVPAGSRAREGPLSTKPCGRGSVIAAEM